MTKLLLDTNILIDILRDNSAAIRFIEKTDAQFFVSAVSIAELYAGSRQSELEGLAQMISGLNIYSLEWDVAKMAGIYLNKYRKSHGVDLADAIIAATADILNLELITLNIKHFPMFKNLKRPY